MGEPESSMRVDAALVERGLVRSRAQAQKLITQGQVLKQGEKVSKASSQITQNDVLELVSFDVYVSRAAHKLLAALDLFEIEISGKDCLDLGTSTGGFAQVLLEKGASRVLGIEVGHGQLSDLLKDESRLVLIEGFNARELSQSAVIDRLGDDFFGYKPEIVVADLSFISLRYVLAQAADYAARNAEFILLLKPQFEVGRTKVRGGIVTEAGDRQQAILDAVDLAAGLGLQLAGVHPSPMTGTHGNHEYLLWFNRTSDNNQAELKERIAQLIDAEIRVANTQPTKTSQGGENSL